MLRVQIANKSVNPMSLGLIIYQKIILSDSSFLLGDCMYKALSYDYATVQYHLFRERNAIRHPLPLVPLLILSHHSYSCH